MTSLFKGKEHVFKDVIQLASARKTLINKSGYDSRMTKMSNTEKTPAEQEIQIADKDLSNYLSKLCFEDVKMLQTVMYLGRDQDYDKSQTPSEIYQDYLNYIGRNGWESKNIEANQLEGKVPLGDYLENGLKILKVSI